MFTTAFTLDQCGSWWFSKLKICLLLTSCKYRSALRVWHPDLLDQTSQSSLGDAVMVPISDGVSFDPTSPQEAGPVPANQVWSSGKHSLGHPQAFFKSWIGKSWCKLTGPAQTDHIHPPPSFSHHRAITRLLTNRWFKEGVRGSPIVLAFYNQGLL